MTETPAKYSVPARAPGDAALVLLKNFEQGPNGGFAPVAYRCPAGHKTIGWGHRIQPDEKFQQPISAVEADRLLTADVARVAEQIRIAVDAPLTQSMVDALVCFTFNVGLGAFFRSTLHTLINARDYRRAADEFLKWNKAKNPKTGQKVPLSGLTRRRQAERELFLREGMPE